MEGAYIEILNHNLHLLNDTLQLQSDFGSDFGSDPGSDSDDFSLMRSNFATKDSENYLYTFG
ncbi:hypothetical protein Glove_5g11 [Diversispora epigaea]|uniref:Uncharacterized protein n=1 Tax=Diversispora epigaea TaxID=1348612 RepID=A0A397JT67_9GLOM|nr:hypothetical protein Glove_5g11 [Diversispora epigaea]